MNYEDTLNEHSLSLGMAIADQEKDIKVTGFSLINEVLNTTTPSLRSQLSDITVDQIKTVLQSVTNMTFNEAVPAVKTVMEKLQQVINPDIPVAYSQHEIIPVIFDDLWDSPLVMEMATNGRNLTPGALNTVGLIKSVDAEEYQDLVTLAQTGLGSFDDQVRALLSTKDGDALRRLFIGVFCEGVFPARNPKACMLDASMDDWILIALWAKKLYDIVPKDSSFSLERYRLGIVGVEQVALATIASIDTQRKSFSEAGRMVIERQGKRLWVVNDLYSSYLKEGGSPEAVLGLLLSSQPLTTVEDIKKAQPQLQKEWDRHVQISTVTHSEQMTSTARRQLLLIMEEMARFHYGDDTGKVSAENQGAYNGARDRIGEIIRNLPSNFTRDAHRWVFDLVAGAFYPNSDVARLMTCLREVGDARDNDLSAEEVKVLATINFMGDWLADITTFVSHGRGKPSYSSPVDSVA